nr:unnamed protein product [Callosobruchus chinensis]
MVIMEEDAVMEEEVIEAGEVVEEEDSAVVGVLEEEVGVDSGSAGDLANSTY